MADKKKQFIVQQKETDALNKKLVNDTIKREILQTKTEQDKKAKMRQELELELGAAAETSKVVKECRTDADKLFYCIVNEGVKVEPTSSQ